MRKGHRPVFPAGALSIRRRTMQEMRRKDRKIKDFDKIIEIMNQCDVCRIALNDEDKFRALKILMRQYHSEDFKFNTEMIKVTTVLKMTVTDMVGKRRDNIHKNEKGKNINETIYGGVWRNTDRV